MSLLTATQGTPNRVFALLRLLEEAGNPMSAEAVEAWMLPRNRIQGQPVSRPKDALDQTISAARSLALVSNNWPLTALVAGPTTMQEFADIAHHQLCGLPSADPNSLVLRIYSWFVLRDGSGAIPVSHITRDQLIDEINASFPREEGDDAKTFNSTKFVPWVRWLSAMGLGGDLPGCSFYAYPVERLSRELRAAAHSLGFDCELEFREVQSMLKDRMPYLDGGAVYEEVARQTGTKTRTLSRVFSAALRELHREGEIRLTTWGDATARVDFFQDPQDTTGLAGVNRICILSERSHGA